jgi:cyclopropane fatty-acyl-phospholipid synthase-like methyltransferase
VNDSNTEIQRSDFYRGYSTYKKWMGRETVDQLDRFSSVFRKLRLRQSANILELGFGDGHFLDWARNNKYHVEGVEILPEMVGHAKARGHIVHMGPIADVDFAGRRFDLLAAFDVVEHLSLPELLDLFQNANYLLKPGGRMLLQFPNASSPFSALYQSGDVTHRSALSWTSLQQMSRTKGWVVTEYFNARVTSTHPIKKLKWWAAHLVRDLIELIFSFAYYGARCPLDPNIIVVLERSRTESPVASDATEG